MAKNQAPAAISAEDIESMALAMGDVLESYLVRRRLKLSEEQMGGLLDRLIYLLGEHFGHPDYRNYN